MISGCRCCARFGPGSRLRRGQHLPLVPVVQHELQGHRPVGPVLGVRPHELRGDAVQRAVAVDAPLQLSHRRRGRPGQEPAQDQPAAAVGRHHAHLRRHRPPDADLRPPHSSPRVGSPS
jgi:hypothetical protein